MAAGPAVARAEARFVDSDVPKIVSLVRLMVALDEGTHDFESLRRRLGGERLPSTRTLRRYLATLAEAGIPWSFERRTGFYVLAQSFALRRLELSGSELFGLSALRGIASSLGGEIGASMDEVAQKLSKVGDRRAQRSVEHAPVRVQLPDTELDPQRHAHFLVLQQAQVMRQSVRFAYVDKSGRKTDRHVDPYGFIMSGGRVYLVAYDHRRGAQRTFALDAIATVRTMPTRFEIPRGFSIAELTANSISGVMQTGSVTRVTIRFEPVVAGAAKADRIVRDRTLEERPDGGVDITYVVADPEEIIRWSLRWGAEAQIVAPAAVRRRAGLVAKQIAANYGPQDPSRSPLRVPKT